jgi:protein-S-isoprenylcysteine O-methyltransferase Ste14
MTYQNVFFIFLLWFIFGFQHSLLAQKNFKDKLCNVLGENFILYFYRIIYTIIQCIIFTIIWNLISNISPGNTIFILDESYHSTIYIFKKASEFLLLWSVLAIDINYFIGTKQFFHFFRYRIFLKNNINQPEPAQVLTNSILFKHIRHPMYLGILLNLLFSTTTYTEIFFYNVIFLYVYIEIGIYFEEKQLVRLYKDTYLAYRNKTPKIFPFIKF